MKGRQGTITDINEAPASRAPFTVLAVERAIGELRRGRPVTLIGGGGHVYVAMAAETMRPESVKEMRKLAGHDPLLAITARRAAVLDLAVSAGKIAIISGIDGLAVDDIRTIADPLSSAPPSAELRERLSVTVREEPGHDGAAAAVVLTKVARLLPAAVIAPITDVGDPIAWSHRHDFLSVDTGDVFQFERAADRNLTKVAEARVPVGNAENTRVVAFRPADGGREHLAIVIGQPDPTGPVLVRLHSECFTGDLLGSLRCDCGDQLHGALEEIKTAGAGVLLYLAQEGRGIGLINKLRAYELQDSGFDTVDANEQLGFDADERVYLPAARMLKLLGIGGIRLMTNNPDKVDALKRYGVDVVERVQHAFPSNEHNEFYLQTKAKRSGHQF